MKSIHGRSVRTSLALMMFCLFLYGAAARAAAAESLTKLTDNVYAYVDTHKATPMNSFGANAGIIIGREGIAVVDTLISAKEADRFIRDIRAVSDKPIRYVIDTHSHLDHTFGNAEFVKLGGVVVSHASAKKNILANGEANLKKAGAYGLTEKDMEGTRLACPSITFSEKMEIDLGDQIVELIYAGPSHTDDSILVYLPDKKILFTGDILFTNYHPNIVSGDIAGWLKVLDAAGAIGAEKIIPGHGPVSGKKDIENMKDYLIVFDKKARELAAVSGDPQYIAAELKKVLPAREELDSMIVMNLQYKYLRK